MDIKLFQILLDYWRECNVNLDFVIKKIEIHNLSYAQRAILLNLYQGLNRRSYKIVKMLEEVVPDDEKKVVEKEE